MRRTVHVAWRARRLTNSDEEGFPESFSSHDLPTNYPDPEPRGDPPQHAAYTPNSSDGHPHPNFPPPFLAGAHITAQNVNHHWRGDTGIDILHRTAALEALYDSAHSYPQPRCHPETRTEMLDKLYSWCTEDDTEHPICWLHGPAGAGKSAIMQTLSRRLQDAHRLGGAFFFKRHHPIRGNAKVLFATLGYQLALNNRDLKPIISTTVEIDPSIVTREMDVQLHKLIIEPCQSLTYSPPAILLLDGLDECQDERTQERILRLIGNAAGQCPTGIRTIVASRPESHLWETMEEFLFDGFINSTDVEQSFHDVQTYLRDEFTRIHSEHRDTMASVPRPWPSAEILNNLVKKSSGYFVYASTVIKFVDDPYSRPTERLEIIQDLKPTHHDAPFEVLDNFYHQILSGVRPQFHSRLLCILQCVAYGHALGSAEIDYILGLQSGDTKLILRALHSVLSIQPNDG
ncbi:hypothetical protein B0H16DRAFT_375863 [Mycena metata]|uniref:Nephrocystin 3-like N-terminal domain-containing protein n=1 Tax=Mycena metata TaxID=1033252 RepID=A0AAD7HIL3_9AGAR|nr:hypothetical protein B0H16DRAFT_375863 [Mycena metata]